MARGTITRLEPSEFREGETGYGFITGVDEDDDGARIRYFFNRSGVQLSSVPIDGMKVGDPCNFTPIDHPDGPRAIEVRVVDRNQQGLW